MKQTLRFSASSRPIERWNTKQSRLYLFVEGENVLENLQNRFDRPVKEYRKLLAPIFQLLGVEKARWSQKAGCSCGCSPGFVLDRKVCLTKNTYGISERGDDLYVTVTGAPKHAGNPRDLTMSDIVP